MQETWETQVRSLGQEDPLQEDMAPHSGALAWRSPRTEDPGGLQSTRSQRVEHDWGSLAHQANIKADINHRLYFFNPEMYY